MPRCRHIGCVVSHGAAAVSCCVRVIGTCVTCVTYAGRATMTRRGGGHRKVCRGTCRDMGKLRLSPMADPSFFLFHERMKRLEFMCFEASICGPFVDEHSAAYPLPLLPIVSERRIFNLILFPIKKKHTICARERVVVTCLCSTLASTMAENSLSSRTPLDSPGVSSALDAAPEGDAVATQEPNGSSSPQTDAAVGSLGAKTEQAPAATNDASLNASPIASSHDAGSPVTAQEGKSSSTSNNSTGLRHRGSGKAESGLENSDFSRDSSPSSPESLSATLSTSLLRTPDVSSLVVVVPWIQENAVPILTKVGPILDAIWPYIELVVEVIKVCYGWGGGVPPFPPSRKQNHLKLLLAFATLAPCPEPTKPIVGFPFYSPKDPRGIAVRT